MEGSFYASWVSTRAASECRELGCWPGALYRLLSRLCQSKSLSMIGSSLCAFKFESGVLVYLPGLTEHGMPYT